MNNGTSARPPVCLSVAGSDPCSGAGIQLDSRVFVAFNCYPTTIPAVITVQNTHGVKEVTPLSVTLVSQQLEWLLDDISPNAGKTGALGTAEIAECVFSILHQRQVPVVVDPVFNSSSHSRLFAITPGEFAELVQGRIALCTPNIPEAESLLGRAISSVEDMLPAAVDLQSLLACPVLLTGGHLGARESGTENESGADESSGKSRSQGLSESIDALVVEKDRQLLRGPRHPQRSEIHGTGCALSAAITAHLALGEPLASAVEKAKIWLAASIAHPLELGGGSYVLDFRKNS